MVSKLIKLIDPIEKERFVNTKKLIEICNQLVQKHSNELIFVTAKILYNFIINILLIFPSQNSL